MGGRGTRTGTVVVGIVALAVAAYGGYAVYRGLQPREFGVALALVGIAAAASYHTLSVRGGFADASAVGNAALFLGGAGVYFGGFRLGVEPAEVAGEALFAIAVGYFVYLTDQS